MYMVLVAMTNTKKSRCNDLFISLVVYTVLIHINHPGGDSNMKMPGLCVGYLNMDPFLNDIVVKHAHIEGIASNFILYLDNILPIQNGTANYTPILNEILSFISFT